MMVMHVTVFILNVFSAILSCLPFSLFQSRRVCAAMYTTQLHPLRYTNCDSNIFLSNILRFNNIF